MDPIKHALKRQLDRTQRLHVERRRRDDINLIIAVEEWQKARLERTYADLSAQARYERAADFFVNELYAPIDVMQRDADLERMYPTMVRLLPQGVLETVERAMRLQGDTLELDADIAEGLAAQGVRKGQPLEAASYVAVFAEHQELAVRRREQVKLVLRVGWDLDKYVHVPFIYTTLKMARIPARLAGLSRLQQFLENGFGSFKAMGSAESFLEIIEQREIAICDALDAGDVGALTG